MDYRGLNQISVGPNFQTKPVSLFLPIPKLEGINTSFLSHAR